MPTPRRSRRPADLTDLVASLGGRDVAEIAVLGPAGEDLLDAVRAAWPSARVSEIVGDGSAAHVAMTALGPFDVVIDGAGADGRRLRFEATFFHLRAGGTYVVPDGAGEVGRRRGPLGELLEQASLPSRSTDESSGGAIGSAQRWAREQRLLAVIGKRVTHRVVGRDLLLSHDVPDVLVKMREDEFNSYLGRVETPHRLLATIPAEPPPPAPPGGEGPEPRPLPMHRPISPAEISLRDYRDVIVAPKQVLISGRLLLPDTHRHNQWPVLTHERLTDYTARFARPRRALPSAPPRLAGTYLHLDNEFRGHFGHLMTESMSRFWSWPEAVALDPDVRVLLGVTSKRPTPLEYELQLYEAGGIPRDRIVVIDGPVTVERLISGTPMFSHPQYVHPRIAQTWRQVGDRLAAQAAERDWPRRFFVSRRSEKRACRNGDEVEAIFAEYGFETVYPEDYSLGEQVRLFRGAEVIAGYAGSGLFQIALVPDPTHVIVVGPATYTPRNEYLLAAVNGHRIDAVICQGTGLGIQTSYSFDLDREGPYLRGLLDELP